MADVKYMANTIKCKLAGKTFDMGAGRYSSFGAELARDCHRLLADVEPEQCIAAAQAAMSDCGRLNISSKVSVGKAKGEEMKTTVKEVGSLKGVIMTRSLELVRAISLLNALEYVAVTRVLLNDDLQGWFENLAPAVPEVEEVPANA